MPATTFHVAPMPHHDKHTADAAHKTHFGKQKAPLSMREAMQKKADNSLDSDLGLRKKKEPLQMHERIRANGRVLDADGGKSPWRVARTAVGQNVGAWTAEMGQRRGQLESIRVQEEGRATEKMQENVLPYMLAYSRKRFSSNQAPSLAAYHHEVAESMLVVERTRHRFKHGDPPPATPDPGDTVDAVHAASVLEAKRKLREKKLAKMRLRQDERRGDGTGDPIPDKPEGMEALERRQKRLRAAGKDLNFRENFELQRFVVRWTDSKAEAAREKKKREKHLLRMRYRAKMKDDTKVKRGSFFDAMRRGSQRLSRRLSQTLATSSADGDGADGDGGAGDDDGESERDPSKPLTPRSAAKEFERTLDAALQGLGGRDTLQTLKGRRDSQTTTFRIRNISPAKLGAKVAAQIRIGFAKQNSKEARPKTARGQIVELDEKGEVDEKKSARSVLLLKRAMLPFSPVSKPKLDANGKKIRRKSVVEKLTGLELHSEAAISGTNKFKKAVRKLQMKNMAFNVIDIRAKKGQEAFALQAERDVIHAGLVAKELQKRKDAEELESFGVFADAAPGVQAKKDFLGGGDEKPVVNLDTLGHKAPKAHKHIQREPATPSRLKAAKHEPQYPEGVVAPVPEVQVHHHTRRDDDEQR